MSLVLPKLVMNRRSEPQPPPALSVCFRLTSGEAQHRLKLDRNGEPRLCHAPWPVPAAIGNAADRLRRWASFRTLWAVQSAPCHQPSRRTTCRPPRASAASSARGGFAVKLAEAGISVAVDMLGAT